MLLRAGLLMVITLRGCAGEAPKTPVVQAPEKAVAPEAQPWSLEEHGIEKLGPHQVRVAHPCLEPFFVLASYEKLRGRFIPSMKNGRLTGMKLFHRTNGALAGIGLERGDVVKSVAGTPLVSAEALQAALDVLRNKTPDVIRFELARRHDDLTIEVLVSKMPSRCLFFRTAPGL